MNRNPNVKVLVVPRTTKQPIKIKEEVIIKDKRPKNKSSKNKKSSGVNKVLSQRTIIGDIELNRATDAMIAATLHPEKYESRGLASWGGAKSSLASFTTKFSFNAFNSTTQSDLWLYILPTALGGSWCTYIYSASSVTAPSTGWTTLAPVVSGVVSISSRSRLIGFELKFVPTGALTARAGTIAGGVYQVATTGPGAAGSAVSDLSITSADFKLQADGNTTLVYTFVPSNSPAWDPNGFTSGDTSLSNLCVHISGTTGVQYSLFVTARFEICPLLAYRPFFSVGNPEARNDTIDYLGFLINKFPALVIGDDESTTQQRMLALAGRNIPLSSVNWATSGGVGSGGPSGFADSFVPMQDIDGDADNGTEKRVMNMIQKTACQLDVTGLGKKFGLCDDVSPLYRGQGMGIHQKAQALKY
jgi:hypothetical protein